MSAAARARLLCCFLALAWWTAAPTPVDAAPAVATRTLYSGYLSARAAFAAGDFQQAAMLLEPVIAAAPEDSMLTRLAFISALRAGLEQRAFVLARRLAAETTNPEPLALLMTGLAAVRGGNAVEARAAFARIDDPWLKRSALPLALAWSYAAVGEETLAITALEPLRETAPGLEAFMRGAIHDRFGHGNATMAAWRLAGAESADEPPLLTLTLISLHARQGQRAKAIALATAFVERERSGGFAQMARDALQRLRQGHRLPPLLTTPASAIAEGLLQLAFITPARSWDATLDPIRLALWLDPGLDRARLSLGDLFNANGDTVAANAAYAAIPRQSPYFRQARLRRAATLPTLGREAEATTLLERAAADPVDGRDALALLAQLHHNARRYQEMEAVLDRLLHQLPPQDPDRWRALFERGIARERQNHLPEAEADLLVALALNPRDPDVLNTLGYIWVEKGRNLDRALTLLTQAVEIQPSGYILDSLGWAYYRLRRYDDAARTLEQAVALEPLEAVINDHLGEAYWQAGRRREALFQWQRVLELDSSEIDRQQVAAKIRDGLPRLP